LAEYYARIQKTFTFASVFHGIRFKVRRLFVVMTSNFFWYLLEKCFREVALHSAASLFCGPTGPTASAGAVFGRIGGNGGRFGGDLGAEC
jgi:hypothetical protein